MSAAKGPTPQGVVTARPVRRLTLEDVRAKAQHVQDTATRDVNDIVKQIETNKMMYVIVGVAVAASVAYYLGSKAGAKAGAKSAAKRLAKQPPVARG